MTTEWLKQQKLTCNSSGGWEISDQVLASLVPGESFLLDLQVANFSLYLPMVERERALVSLPLLIGALYWNRAHFYDLI